MTKPGRKPMPIERRRLLGNPGKRPLPARGTLRAVSELGAPASTPEAALRRAVEAAKGWLAETDLPAVAVAREALELFAELRADPQAKPADVIAAGRWMQSAFGDLGFTPGERARLGLAEVTAAKSVLDELRESQDAHRAATWDEATAAPDDGEDPA